VKGFKFKLQSVLDARQKKLENSQLEFAKAQHHLHQENIKLSNLIKILEETCQGLEQVLKAQMIDSTSIFIHQNYITTTKQNIVNQKLAIKQAELELDEKNLLMLEALKDKKVMEKLKEKALSEFTEKINHQEMVMIDEIATCRYARN